jgi:hypothetical protein
MSSGPCRVGDPHATIGRFTDVWVRRRGEPNPSPIKEVANVLVKRSRECERTAGRQMVG